MDEIGIVKSVNGPVATVSVEKKSACESCKAGCKVSDSGVEIEAFNEAKALVGQRVRIEMKPYLYLKGSILIYGIPALALIIGAVIGKEFISAFFTDIDPDMVSAISGFAMFFLSFIIVKVWSMRLEKKTEYKPVIAEVLEQ